MKEIKIPVEKQAENATKWIEALLSGKYNQGIYRLGNQERGFCCWGLGCQIVELTYDSNEGWDHNLSHYIGYLNETGSMRPIPIIFNGDQELNMVSLADLNDTAKWTFPEIANYLIENAETNFIPEVANAIKTKFSKN